MPRDAVHLIRNAGGLDIRFVIVWKFHWRTAKQTGGGSAGANGRHVGSTGGRGSDKRALFLSILQVGFEVGFELFH